MHENPVRLNATNLKCSQCKAVCDIEDEICADTCVHYKCRECILASDDTSRYQCTIRDARTNYEYKELSGTGVVQYHCTSCGKTFHSRSQKYYHLQCNQIHSELYECDICEKTFARPSQLKYHKESHTSPINKCLTCHKIFSNPLALKKHETLHKVEPKPCPRCDKSFLKKSSLEQHIAAQHLHQLQYECTNCNKKYASKSTLHLHLQSHEKKRFECRFCGKFFQRNSILNLHLKRHSHTDITYNCQVCGKLFSESGALARHRKIHEENALQYRCKLCDKNILRKDNMARHVNTIHPEDKFDDIVEIIRPPPEYVNNNLTSDIAEEHLNHPIKDEFNNDKDLPQVGNCNEIGTKTENRSCINKYPNIDESKQLEPRDNIVILENRLLQSPTSLPYNRDLCQASQTGKIPVLKYTECHDNMPLKIVTTNNCLVNKIEVITPLFTGEGVETNKKLYEYMVTDRTQSERCFGLSLKNNQEPCKLKDRQAANQVENIECNLSSLLQFDPDTSFDVPRTISDSDASNTNTHINSRNEATSRLANSKSIPTENGSKNFKNFMSVSQPRLMPTSRDYCETIDQALHNKASVIRSIGNVNKALTQTTTASETLVTHVPLDCEYKHKKYKRQYNVDLYRKILGCDDEYDNEDDNQEQHECIHQEEKRYNSCEITNVTPVHWRKNFKNSYETSSL